MVQLVIDQAAVHGSLVVPCGLVVHQTHILKEDALHKGRTALGEGCFIMQISVQKTNCRTDCRRSVFRTIDYQFLYRID